jgi:peptidoglycan hydrolase-like protein with peptidoglycan-binding domain
MGDAPADAQLSEDGAFWWDGEQWQPIAPSVEPLGYGEQLARGDRSDQVGELQRRLAHLGYYQGNADGAFNEETEIAVKEFQRAAGHTDDGIAQADTWQELEDFVNAHGYGTPE